MFVGGVDEELTFVAGLAVLRRVFFAFDLESKLRQHRSRHILQIIIWLLLDDFKNTLSQVSFPC